MKVFIIITDKIYFFKSLSKLESYFNIIVDLNTKEIVNYGGYYYRYLTGNNNQIFEFDFKDNEPITFMRVDGPSEEYFTFTKQKSLNFFKKCSDYLSNLSTLINEEGDEIVVTSHNYNNYDETIYEYFSGGTSSHFMVFKFIKFKSFQ